MRLQEPQSRWNHVAARQQEWKRQQELECRQKLQQRSHGLIGTEAPRALELQELGDSRSHGIAMRGAERS